METTKKTQVVGIKNAGIVIICCLVIAVCIFQFLLALNPQLHSRSATYKRNGLLIRKTAIKSSRPFQCAYYPLTP